MGKIFVDLDEYGYDIIVEDGSLSILSSAVAAFRPSALCVVSDNTVATLYLKHIVTAVEGMGFPVYSVVVEEGETSKSWAGLSKIYDVLLQNACDRKVLLVALGGGVVGDLTGFAAATFMRGVPFIQVPTTLLAQVDSSVGGKTAINHPLGKNMIGAFYQPQLVVCDLSTLRTLPLRELSAGLAEVIKYGPIADMAFMGWLEGNMESLMRRESSALAHAVQRCCEIKAEVVSQDEKETGLRAILNFGHTFGHAIEAGMGYGVWLHGEGVAAGMVMAAELSQRLGLVDAAFVLRLRRLIERAGLPVRGAILDPKDNAGRYLELMRHDKKSQAGAIRFVLIDGPGKAIVREAPDALVREVIDACCA